MKKKKAKSEIPRSLKFTKRNDGQERCTILVPAHLTRVEIFELYERSEAFDGTSSLKSVRELLGSMLDVGWDDWMEYKNDDK